MPLPSSLRRPRVLLAIAGVVVVLGILTAYFLWHRPPPLPAPGTARYEDYAEAFEVGTAALDSGLVAEAIEKLTLAIENIPEEPAAWANRALAYLRQPQPDLIKAKADLLRAQSLAPDNADVEELLGHLAERTGKLDEAIAHFRKASAGDPDNLRRLYKQIELLERDADDQARQQLAEQILERRPTNLHLLALRLQLALRRRDQPALRDTLARLQKLSPGWNDQARNLFAEVAKEILSDKADVADLNLNLSRLDNLFKGEPGYARGMSELNPPVGQTGDALQQFVKLAPLRTAPSPPDVDLTFEAKPLPWQVKDARWDVILPAWLNGTDAPVVLVANAREVRRTDGASPIFAFPSGANATPPTLAGVLAVDWNNDQLMDFVLAGAGGLRFFEQQEGGKFTDVTERTKLPASVLQGDLFGAWVADVDMDGDLDIILAPRQGPVRLLRNNGDGTFVAMTIFSDVDALRAFAWADLDNDGAPDAVLLDEQGRLHVFLNERSSQFRRHPLPDSQRHSVAITVADVDGDGAFDVVTLTQDGRLVRLSDKDKGRSWDLAELTKPEEGLTLSPGNVLLQAIDLDSNGTIDVVLRTATGGVAWLADGYGGWTKLPAAVPPGVAEIVSLGENAQLDLLGLDKAGQPTCFATKGTKGYHWGRVKVRADPKGAGDQRVNSFDVGGEIELRSGTLVVKQLITQPTVPFGLGSRQKVSLLRLVSTNGALQYEFDKPLDAVIRVEQRLKGSCPFLFTWDGKQIVFVSDFCWSTPLGLYINAQKRGGGFTETTEWIKIRGDQLVPSVGYYDVRVQANLWETHYLDYLALMVVDHPPNTEVFCDERFFLTPTKPRLYLTQPPKPVTRAWDHHGEDVTELVRAVDGRHLASAGLGLYQGVTQDHWVEIDLGDDAPREGAVYLIARGWLQPTDSSINVALEQSSHPKPQPLMLEVHDGKGRWKAVGPPLGFPAGKNKTLVIRLDGVEGPGVTRRFRLRTNLEIYWDALHYAREDPSSVLETILTPRSAELGFRGIVETTRANRYSPELPRYDQVVCTAQPWRDLIGFHTRFGEVKELLEKVDDRYVILNAGDEIRMRFDVPPRPPPGWKRDYVWISDGWTKDGDFNTTYGKTVLPLPYHGMSGYDKPPGRLRDDPVYRKHAKDWETYHTRYVAPVTFERGLRSASGKR